MAQQPNQLLFAIMMLRYYLRQPIFCGFNVQQTLLMSSALVSSSLKQWEQYGTLLRKILQFAVKFLTVFGSKSAKNCKVLLDQK